MSNFQQHPKALRPCLLVLSILCLLVSQATNAEYYSAIDSLTVLAQLELDLIDIYRQYVVFQQQEINKHRRFLAHAVNELHDAFADPEGYLGNGLNAFKMIKRHVVDWADLNDVIKQNFLVAKLGEVLAEVKKEYALPDHNEIAGAARGIARLQQLYKLSASDLARGIINGVSYGSILSTRDCFEMGAALFEAREYPLALSWFKLVWKRLRAGKKPENVNSERRKVKGPLGLDENEGNSETNKEFAEKPEARQSPTDTEEDDDNQEAMEDEPNDFDDDKDGNEFESAEATDNENDLTPPSIENKEAFDTLNLKSDVLGSLHTVDENEFSHESRKNLTIRVLEYLTLTQYRLHKSDETISYIDDLLELVPDHSFRHMSSFVTNINKPEFKKITTSRSIYSHSNNYTRLCQGKTAPDPLKRTLKCRLDTRNKANFQLAPLKIEELNLDPQITVYHGLLSDKQIDAILDQAFVNGMQRSKVNSKEGGYVSESRVSQQSWVQWESPATLPVKRLLADLTDFDMINAEIVQVANYGVGGHYDPHFDFLVNNKSKTSKFRGDRISTSMFYFTDVEQGGYTAFPKINVYSAPVKGSMVMWYNLHRSLDPDFRTLHAGCPVIKGTKRVGNVWIHSEYQEFRRPCDLKPDSNKSVGMRDKYL